MVGNTDFGDADFGDGTTTTVAPLRPPAPTSIGSPNVYYEGQLVRQSESFTDINGTPTDPAALTLSWEVVPNGTGSPGSVTTWTYQGAGSIVRDSQGNYHADLDTTGKTGQWQGSFVVPPGSGQTAGPFVFIVIPRPPTH